MWGEERKMRISDDLLLRVVHELKKEIAAREKETARASISDIYAHGRAQGSIDGLDDALSIIDKVIIGENQAEESK